MVADVFHQRAINIVSFEEAYASMSSLFCHFWTQKPQEDLTDIAFQAELPICIQNDFGVTGNSNKNISNEEQSFNGR